MYVLPDRIDGNAQVARNPAVRHAALPECVYLRFAFRELDGHAMPHLFFSQRPMSGLAMMLTITQAIRHCTGQSMSLSFITRRA
jgi:hypothetical protein